MKPDGYIHEDGTLVTVAFYEKYKDTPINSAGHEFIQKLSPVHSAATIRKWLEEVTPEMISAAIGRYLDVSKSHSYKGIYEAMIAAKLQSLEGGE